MNRFLLLSSEPLVGSGEVVVELSHATVPTLALELSLLLGGLADSVRLSANSGASVILAVGGGDTVNKADVKRKSTDTVHFRLGTNQVEYLQAVLLRAYRDGAAEVNHVHVEGSDDDADYDLTLLFERFREPMTGAEAMKLMDD